MTKAVKRHICNFNKPRSFHPNYNPIHYTIKRRKKQAFSENIRKNEANCNFYAKRSEKRKEAADSDILDKKQGILDENCGMRYNEGRGGKMPHK